MRQHLRVLRLLTAAAEQRESACRLHDSHALIEATGAAFRARSLLDVDDQELELDDPLDWPPAGARPD